MAVGRDAALDERSGPGADGEVEAIRMKMLSPDTDFSYDFHDLDLRWVGED